MRRLIIEPDGWPCALSECPPGPFISLAYPDLLCFKSEYSTKVKDEYRCDAYNSAGEYYHGDGLVQPVEMIVEEIEE